MFTGLMKGMLAALALRLARDYRQISLQWLRIEIAKVHLQGVRMARLTALGALGLGLVIGWIVVGALLIHAALFVLLPWSVTAKATLGLALGTIYLVAGGLVLRAAMAERTWMEKSGAARRLAEALDADAHH